MREPEIWESKWKRFLYEGMSTKAIDAEDLNKVFRYFHVSEQKLSKDDYFTFTPRVPRYPLTDNEGNVIEDDFSKRISVAPNVRLALSALGTGAFDHLDGWAHLYAGIGHPDVKAKTEGCPETDDMEYGEQFKLVRWLRQKMFDGDLSIEDAQKLGMRIPPGLWPVGFKDPDWDPNRIPSGIKPSMLPTNLKTEFEHCVPDAEIHGENWLLKPTKLIYVGEIEIATREILLSSAGLQAVKQAGLKYHSY